MTDDEKKEKQKEYRKQYREKNRDKIKEQNKIYREKNISKIKEYQEIHKKHKSDYDKLYREKNKEEIKIWQKNYREINKELLNQKNRNSYKEHIEERRIQYSKYAQSHKDDKREYDKKRYYENINHCVYLIELPNHQMYVGSTNKIKVRIAKHKYDLKNRKNIKLYKAINDCGGWDKVKVYILMDGIPFEDLRLKLEQHYIDMIPYELSLNTYPVHKLSA